VEKYEAILPGAFNRIVTMAEKLQDAQINSVQQALIAARKDTRRGQWLGFVAHVTAIAAAVGCVVAGTITTSGTGPFWVAGALVSVPVMGVAKSLVESARKQLALPMQVAAQGVQPPAPGDPKDRASPPTPDTPELTAAAS